MKEDKRETLVLVNPVAGHGKGKRIMDELGAATRGGGTLSGAGITVRHTPNGEPPEELLRKIREAALVVICGGDGTAHRVINILMDVSYSGDVAVYPVGTGNDLARNLCRRPGDIVTFLKRLIPSRRTARLDVYSLNGSVFFANYAGFGYDAAVVAAYDRLVARFRESVLFSMNFFKYLLLAYAGIQTILFHNGKVRLKGRKEGYTAVLAINLRTYAGGCRYSGNSSISDGKIEMTFMRSKPAFYRLIANWLVPLFRIPAETTPVPYSLSFDGAVPVQMDGEDYTEAFRDTTEFTIMNGGTLNVRL